MSSKCVKKWHKDRGACLAVGAVARGQLRELSLYSNQLTDVKGLEKLTKLERLFLVNNPDLTKAQIDQLQKALPKCKIGHNTKK